MEKLNQIGNGLNAFTCQFDLSLLDEIKDSYNQELRALLCGHENRGWFEGGQKISQSVGTGEYFLTSFKHYPLLWFSCNSPNTYQIYRRFFDALYIEEDIKGLVDHDEKIVMYCGFLVVGDRSPDPSWHVDYEAGANAYTLLTPLFELDPEHGNLMYRVNGNQSETYRYRLGEAILVGDHFMHSTEPYSRSSNVRILISMTFGTDKLKYWDVLQKTIATQSNYTILPCGHRLGKCSCLLIRMARSRLDAKGL